MGILNRDEDDCVRPSEAFNQATCRPVPPITTNGRREGKLPGVRAIRRARPVVLEHMSVERGVAQIGQYRTDLFDPRILVGLDSTIDLGSLDTTWH